MQGVENINCPYCGINRAQFWAAESGYSAVKCCECGLVYVNPRPSLATVRNAVRLGVHATDAGELVVTGEYSAKKVEQFEERLLDIFPGGHLRQRLVRWLDIGTGYGELLLALKRITCTGSVIEGIEPCRPKLERAREIGLSVTDSELRNINGKYDVVSLVNVFSHLPDPQGFILDVGEKLAPKGEILLVTGNSGDIQPEDYRDSFCFPDHLVFAGERHIAAMLERANLRVVTVRKYRDWLPEVKGIRQRIKDMPKDVLGYLTQRSNAFRFLWVRAGIGDKCGPVLLRPYP